MIGERTEAQNQRSNSGKDLGILSLQHGAICFCSLPILPFDLDPRFVGSGPVLPLWKLRTLLVVEVAVEAIFANVVVYLMAVKYRTKVPRNSPSRTTYA